MFSEHRIIFNEAKMYVNICQKNIIVNEYLPHCGNFYFGWFVSVICFYL